MKNLIIENTGNQMVLRINKEGFDEDYLISLVKRLQLEELAEKAAFNSGIMHVAEQINKEWWMENGETFLEGVKK